MAKNSNYAIFRIEKIKSGSEVKALLHEMLPDENDKKRTSPRADETRSADNVNSGTVTESFCLYQKLRPQKVRKNAVVGLSIVVSTSEEFADRETEEKYYEDARTHINKYFGKIVGWSIHRDETSTHMQVITIPLDENNRLNAKKLIGGSSKRMSEIQTNFYNEVGKNYGLERGKIDSKAVHKTVDEFHTQKSKELSDKEKNLETQNAEMLEKGMQIKNELTELINKNETLKTELLEKEKQLEKQKSEVSEREKAVEKKETELAKKQKEFNEKYSFFELNENLWSDYRDRVTNDFDNLKTKTKLKIIDIDKLKQNCINLFNKMKNVFLETKQKLDNYEKKPIQEVIEKFKKAEKSGYKTYAEYLNSQANQKSNLTTNNKPKLKR